MSYYVRWKNKDKKIVVSSFDSIIKARAKLIRLYLSANSEDIYDDAIYTDRKCTFINSFVDWKTYILQTFTDSGRLVRQPFVWVKFNYNYILNKDGTTTGEHIAE